MQKLKNELARQIFNETADEARSKTSCILCKQPIELTAFATGKPGNIYSFAGRREYQISGMCEHCFDKIFDDSAPHAADAEHANEEVN